MNRYRPFIKSVLFIFFYSIFFVCFSSCFTGVESTPKITAKELKKQNITDSKEKHELDGVHPQPPSDWRVGKRFYIADNRAMRGAWRIENNNFLDSIAGKTAVLENIDTIPSLTSRYEVQLKLVIPEDDTEMYFRTGLTFAQWQEQESYELPHIIDMDLVEQVKNKILGKNYFIIPSRRYGYDLQDTIGTRYQPVRILDVVPMSESTPLRVIFNDDEGHISSLLMTIGDLTTSRRNFETLFAISNPRQKYKHIADDVWDLIRHSKVRNGMTPEECRLALGSPDNYNRIPTTAGMIERWSYTNGVYLIFEEGVLSNFRQ